MPVLLWMAVVYFLTNFRIPDSLPGSWNIYFAQPLTWLSLALLSYLGWRFGLQDRPRASRRLLVLALLACLFQISALVLAGIWGGFGHSPYGHDILVLAGNLLYIGTVLAAMEISRAYLVSLFCQGNPFIGVLSTSLLLALMSIPAARLTGAEDAGSLFRVFGESVLPAVAENVLASFLVLVGGPLPAIVYRGGLHAFEWLSPVLPNLGWAAIAFLGTLCPAAGMWMVWSRVRPASASTSVEEATHRAWASWVMVGVAAIGILWLNTGMLGVRPTLVSGVSMSPALLPGDVVITKQVEPEEVAVGSIIRFRTEGSAVLHRVIEIEQEGGVYQFTTQGDANNVADAPVSAEQLEGVVILRIPYIGWIGIAAREVIEWIR